MLYISPNPNFSKGKEISPWILSKNPELEDVVCLCDLVIAKNVRFLEMTTSEKILAESDVVFSHVNNPHVKDLVGRADGKLHTKNFPPRLKSSEGLLVIYAKKVFFLPNGMIFCSISEKYHSEKINRGVKIYFYPSTKLLYLKNRVVFILFYLIYI